MTGPTLTAAALVDELAAIACPVARAVEVKTVARTLRSVFARLHRESLQEARRSGRRVLDLAASTRVTPGRIYQLTTTTRPAAEEAS